MIRQIGVPAEVQQKLMRHADMSTTMRYGRSSMSEELRPANAQLAARLELPKAKTPSVDTEGVQ